MQYKEKLRKRAKRKYLNSPILKNLVALNSPLRGKYIDSFSCSQLIINEDGKLKSRYCKRPWCAVCSPIRTAVRINNYRGELEAIEGLTLTTLTCPNVEAVKIRGSIQTFRRVFRQFRNTYNKRLKKLGFEGKDYEILMLRGVYNFEGTYNSNTKLHHPHIHILHNDIGNRGTGIFVKKGGVIIEKNTNDLIDYWLKKNPLCNIRGQDSVKCFNIVEAFKYQTKSIFSTRVNGEKKPFIPARQLDEFYQQIASLHCFQSFGLKKITQEQESEDMDNLEAYEVSQDLPGGSYLFDGSDWVINQYVDEDTGEVFNYINEGAKVVQVRLSGFVPTDKLKEFVAVLETNKYYSDG